MNEDSKVVLFDMFWCFILLLFFLIIIIISGIVISSGNSNCRTTNNINSSHSFDVSKLDHLHFKVCYTLQVFKQ